MVVELSMVKHSACVVPEQCVHVCVLMRVIVCACVTILPLCLPYSLFVLVSLLGCRWAKLGRSSATWETPGPGVSQDKYTTSPFMEETLSMQTPF